MSAWGQALLANLLVASVFALLAVALGRSGRRPQLVYALWLLCLLKLVTPPIWRVPTPVSWVSKTEAQEERQWTVSPQDAGASAIVYHEVTDDWGSTPATPDWSDVALVVTELGPQSGVDAGPTEKQARFFSAWRPVDWSLAFWALGSLSGLALVWWRSNRFQRLLRRQSRLSEEWTDECEGVAQDCGLDVKPRVHSVCAAIPPLLWPGLRRPTLIVPETLVRSLNSSERACLFAHELGHFARRDPWRRRIELGVVLLFWWFPIAWVARRRLSDLEERFCDAWATKRLGRPPADYAETLLKTMDFLSRGIAATPSTACGFGNQKKNNIMKRFHSILTPGESSRMSWTQWAALGALVAGLGPVSGVHVVAQTSNDDGESEPLQPDIAETTTTEPSAIAKTLSRVVGLARNQIAQAADAPRRAAAEQAQASAMQALEQARQAALQARSQSANRFQFQQGQLAQLDVNAITEQTRRAVESALDQVPELELPDLPVVGELFVHSAADRGWESIDYSQFDRFEFGPFSVDQAGDMPSSFTFHYPHENPQPGLRTWRRSRDGRVWTETYPDGQTSKFRVFGRTRIEDMNGSVAVKFSGDVDGTNNDNEGGQLVFVPDIGPVMKVHFMKLSEGQTEWQELARVLEYSRGPIVDNVAGLVSDLNAALAPSLAADAVTQIFLEAPEVEVESDSQTEDVQVDVFVSSDSAADPFESSLQWTPDARDSVVADTVTVEVVEPTSPEEAVDGDDGSTARQIRVIRRSSANGTDRGEATLPVDELIQSFGGGVVPIVPNGGQPTQVEIRNQNGERQIRVISRSETDGDSRRRMRIEKSGLKLVAPGPGRQSYNWIPLEFGTQNRAGEVRITVTMDDGEAGGSFDVFRGDLDHPKDPEAQEAFRAENSLAGLYDIAPGGTGVVTFALEPGVVYVLGATGNWPSEPGATNRFSIVAELGIPNLAEDPQDSGGRRMNWTRNVFEIGGGDAAPAEPASPSAIPSRPFPTPTPAERPASELTIRVDKDGAYWVGGETQTLPQVARQLARVRPQGRNGVFGLPGPRPRRAMIQVSPDAPMTALLPLIEKAQEMGVTVQLGVDAQAEASDAIQEEPSDDPFGAVAPQAPATPVSPPEAVARPSAARSLRGMLTQLVDSAAIPGVPAQQPAD